MSRLSGHGVPEEWYDSPIKAQEKVRTLQDRVKELEATLEKILPAFCDEDARSLCLLYENEIEEAERLLDSKREEKK